MAAMPLKNNSKRRAAKPLGIKPERIGKAQARQQFLPLVAEIEHSPKVIEITDHEKPVAVLISYNHWRAMVSKLAMYTNRKRISARDLIGSGEIIGDLEEASREISKMWLEAFEESAKNL